MLTESIATTYGSTLGEVIKAGVGAGAGIGAIRIKAGAGAEAVTLHTDGAPQSTPRTKCGCSSR